MKKILLYTLIIICCVVVCKRLCCMERLPSRDKQVQNKIVTVARNLFLDIFPDNEIEEIMVEPSNDYVNFVHDELYKIEVLYRDKEKFKKVTFNIGIYKRNFITPSKIELLMLDKKALIVESLKE